MATAHQSTSLMLAETLHLQALLVFAELPMQRLRFNVNGSSSYGGINITDPVDNTALNISNQESTMEFLFPNPARHPVLQQSIAPMRAGPGFMGQSASGDGAWQFNKWIRCVQISSSSLACMLIQATTGRCMLVILCITPFISMAILTVPVLTSALMQN